jgi:predicted flap endonuclease-1-like 5' DNA nuclease
MIPAHITGRDRQTMLPLGAGVLAGVFAGVALIAGAVGWVVHRMGEDARRRALEASVREQIRAAGLARDRAREEAQDVEERLHRLREEHSGCSERIASLEEAFVNQETKVAALRADLTGKDERLTELESQAESGAAELTALTSRLESLKKLRGELLAARAAHSGCAEREQRAQARIEELQSSLEVTQRQRKGSAPDWLLSAPQGRKDDLKTIRGLGPVIERHLNGIGIFHYHQLARMTSKDVHWIAGRISAFPGLNKRYRWAEQARGMGRPNGGNGNKRRG